MAIYLKKFENHTQYETYINGSGAILPNVSICTTEGDVHYNPYVPPTPVETRVVAKFNVTSTSSPTQLCYSSSINQFSTIEIDGVAQPSVVDEYTFSTTGEHTVKYTLTDPTSIGGYAFYYCSGLTSIDIPSGVTSIGEQAFSDCNSLTSIAISDSVTTIGNSAFYNCYNLTSCTIGTGVTSISDNMFVDCYALTSIVIPNNVTSIGYGAFWGCSNLTSVTIGSGVSEIGNCAFYDCGSLDAASIAAIEAIDPNAFYCD